MLCLIHTVRGVDYELKLLPAESCKPELQADSSDRLRICLG